jgi:hypothetical protein
MLSFTKVFIRIACPVLCISLLVMSAFSRSSAKASVTGCTDGGQTCLPLYDWDTEATWNQTFGTSGYGNTYSTMYWTSKEFINTGDDLRYALFDMYMVQNPDTSQSVYNYDNSTPDYSQSGKYSTEELLLWSVNRTKYSSCSASPWCVGGIYDQEDYPLLEPDGVCHPDGGNSNTSLGGALPDGYTWGYSLSTPTNYSCLTVPGGVDRWSRYYDYTLTSSFYANQQFKYDYLFAQVEPNNYSEHNRNWFGLDYMVKMQYMQWNGPLIGYIPFSVNSGVWGENYTYGVGGPNP